MKRDQHACLPQRHEVMMTLMSNSRDACWENRPSTTEGFEVNVEMQSIVRRIASSFFGEQITSINEVLHKGSVNQVFLIEFQGNKAIIRLNHDERAFLDYQKESWCISQAHQKGIPSPKVFTIGKVDEYAYMIESFVAGRHGEDENFNRHLIWKTLGQYVRRISSIQVNGFGENLTDPRTGQFTARCFEGFDGTWSGYISYNINSLTTGDKLIDLGVLTTAQSRTVRNMFEKLYDYKFHIGLNHGDISLKNTMIGADGTVHLLDWGSAEVNPAPFWDTIQVLRCHITQNNPTRDQYLAFIEGLGISQDAYREQELLINSLLLLRAFDKLRWAIDRSPGNVPDFSIYAKEVLQRLGV